MQIIKGINSGIVSVAPAELQSIIAHRGNVHPLHSCGNVPMDYFPLPGELLDASSARAILPKVPGRIGTKMTVVPDDVGLDRTYPFYNFGL